MMTQLNEAASRLRQRMIDDMNMRKLSPKTQIGYIRAVAKLAGYIRGVTAISDSISRARYVEYHHQYYVIRPAISLLQNP
jgi:hypothetical protein